MVPYCFLVGIPLVFSFFYNLKSEREEFAIQKQEKKNYNVLIFFILLIVLLSLRAESVGIDLPVYKHYFFKYGGMEWSKLFTAKLDDEIGYFTLNKLANVLSGGEFQALLVATALCACIPIMIMYYRESENGVITILLFLTATSVFDMLFSGVRQSIAIALAVPTFYFVKNKKFIWFLLCVFFATLFHQSALILLLMYPTYHIKLKPVHAVMVLAPATVVTYFFRNQIFTLLLPLAGEEYVDKYGVTQDTGATTMVLLVAMFVVFSFMVPDEEKMDDVSRGLRNILSLSLILQIFALTNFIAMRFNYYFLLFLPLTIPRIINRWKGDDKSSKIFTSIVIITFFAAYYFYRAFTDRDPLEIYPYAFFWQ